MRPEEMIYSLAGPKPCDVVPAYRYFAESTTVVDACQWLRLAAMTTAITIYSALAPARRGASNRYGVCVSCPS